MLWPTLRRLVALCCFSAPLVAAPAKTASSYNPSDYLKKKNNVQAEAAAAKPGAKTAAGVSIVCEPEQTTNRAVPQAVCPPGDPSCSSLLEHQAGSKRGEKTDKGSAAALAQVISHVADNCRPVTAGESEQKGFRPEVGVSLDGVNNTPGIADKTRHLGASFGVSGYF